MEKNQEGSIIHNYDIVVNIEDGNLPSAKNTEDFASAAIARRKFRRRPKDEKIRLEGFSADNIIECSADKGGGPNESSNLLQPPQSVSQILIVNQPKASLDSRSGSIKSLVRKVSQRVKGSKKPGE